MNSELPLVACSLDASGQSARLAEWDELLRLADLRQQIPDGVRYTFAAPAIEEGLCALAAAEKEERFEQVVVGTAVGSRDAVVDAVAGGQHQHRCPGARRSQLLAGLEAADPGQHQVAYDRVVLVAWAIQSASSPLAARSATTPSLPRPRWISPAIFGSSSTTSTRIRTG